VSRVAAAALAAVLVLLTGCARTIEAERRANVDRTWRETVDLGDRSVSALLALHPDLTLVEVDGDFSGESWIDCSGSIVGNAVSPTEIIWSTLRDVEVQPVRETASLADSLADWWVGEGWQETQTLDQDGGHLTDLVHGDYSIGIISDAVIPEHRPPIVRIIVDSPCVPAPEQMIDWTPPADAPTSTPGP
jgi:hypothetical protein